MDKIPDKSQEIILLGDLNINLGRKQESWTATTTSLGLVQVIKEHTRVTDNTQTLLDHIYTKNENKISNARILDNSISDHSPIYCSYTMKTPKIKKNHIPT